MRWSIYRRRRVRWVKWFAWYPVKVEEEWVWLEWVDRSR